MSVNKSVLMVLLALGISSLSCAALAVDSLIIENKTNMDSTSKVNSGRCSTDLLGEQGGVTKKGETKSINNITLRAACFPKTDTCKAQVFMHTPGTKKFCSGEAIATITVAVSSNKITGIEGPTQGYSIEKISDTHIRFSGGPSASS